MYFAPALVSSAKEIFPIEREKDGKDTATSKISLFFPQSATTQAKVRANWVLCTPSFPSPFPHPTKIRTSSSLFFLLTESPTIYYVRVVGIGRGTRGEHNRGDSKRLQISNHFFQYQPGRGVPSRLILIPASRGA